MNTQQKFIAGGGSVLIIALVLFGIFSDNPTDEAERGEFVSSNGLHYHPRLSIFIDEEEVEIPANIGLSAGHSPMHTHGDDPNVIHAEYPGIVYEKDLKLGRFFETWDKDFSATSLLGQKDGSVTMTVNGDLNNEYEDYIMQNGDEIVLSYATESENVEESPELLPS